MADHDTYLSIIGLLQNGSPEDWEALARERPEFPGGSDSLVDRHWLTNAIDCGSLQSIQWMLSRGVEVNFRDAEGYPSLHSCLDRSTSDRYDILRLLLDAGADANMRGSNDWTPLHHAAANEDLEALRILLAHGADPTVRTRVDDYTTPEEEARKAGRHQAADLLAKWKPT